MVRKRERRLLFKHCFSKISKPLSMKSLLSPFCHKMSFVFGYCFVVQYLFQSPFKAFECFSNTFQGKLNFQGLFKTVLYIQALFKPVRTLSLEGKTERWLFFFDCLLDVMWLLVCCVSSTKCCGLVCGVVTDIFKAWFPTQ